MAKKSPTNLKALRHALGLFDTKVEFAAAVGVRQNNVSMWLTRKSVPAEHCPAIERATAGKVRCEDLRPDVAWNVLRAA